MFTRLIDALRIARDDFKSKALVIFKERAEVLNTINRDFRQGSPSQKDALANMEEKYNGQLDKLRATAMEFINAFFENAREYETKRVKKFDVATINAIKSISDLPMSYSEIVVLNDFYGKERNYWVEKMFVEIAEKNGISAESLGLESSYETKMDVIKQLEQEFIEMINEFDDKNTYKNGAYLHDAILTKAEMKYRNSLNSNNSEQLAHHLFGLLTSKGTINEQGVAINNVMRNADEMTKLEFMYLIANSNVSEESIKCSGYYNLFEEFKTKTVEEFGKAKAVMNMIKQTNDLNEIKKLMQDIEDNKYINSMLVNNKENYSSIREYLNEEG